MRRRKFLGTTATGGLALGQAAQAQPAQSRRPSLPAGVTPAAYANPRSGYSPFTTPDYYTYTDDFDDDYQELNLSLGSKIFSISAAIGQYDNFDGPTGDGGEGSLDYVFVAPRVDYKGFYGLVGMFSQDFDTTYYEVGYGSQFEPIGLDYKVSLIHTDDTLIKDFEESESGETTLVFSISKTFGLLK